MDEAIRANRAKSDFLSSMSHELRTPMNSILGFAQLLYDDPDDPLSENHQRFTKRILDGGRHLLVLIDQVLDLSRIESGRLAMTLADVDVCQSIHDCLNMTETIASERQVNLSAGEGVKGALPCRADPHRFSQILLNLLSNAIKYNREGGTVCVDAAPCEPGWLRISVADSGQGI
ncbi:MAG: histidine kinase dimerization/phospho-acceptor domain-containing protein, partial [Rickettsiales bacterium]